MHRVQPVPGAYEVLSVFKTTKDRGVWRTVWGVIEDVSAELPVAQSWLIHA